MDQVVQLRAILRERAEKLLDTSRQSLNELTELKQVDADAVDQAANESDRGFSLRLADRDRLMLRKIRKALERIDEGEYGCCESCGENITHKRLLARPVATLCIDCKTTAEQQERRRWDF
ncbi:MAG: RNA polymerase-binding protein DksA [Proteobacteria bacterium]|nr:RNA polymerase-binding protein DksA [Pseudomonadota bacterium]MCP4920285.1 RNA polymerase-binding protein DksA [Pseudomonadota bacterium]